MDIQTENSSVAKPERRCVTLKIETWEKLTNKKTQDKKRSIDQVITELLEGGIGNGNKTDNIGGEKAT
jgi:hypothetical protein